MPMNEFWYDEPELLWTYRTFYMNKQKAKAEDDNYNAWLLGSYFWDVVSKVIYNNFSRRNGPALEYMERPYELKSQSEEERRIEKKKRLEEKIKERNQKIKEILKNNKKE